MSLQNQVKCGAAERHNFRLTRATDCRKVADAQYVWGYFVCNNCELEISRKLTDSEINAAEVLNMIQ